MQLTVPTPFPVGPVNLYALQGEKGFYLIDAGVATPEARQLIKDWLPAPLQGILVTHGHPDHLGLAAEIAREHNCPVYLNEDEFQRLKEPGSQALARAELLIQGGVPGEMLAELTEVYQKSRQSYVVPLQDVEVRALKAGDVFETVQGPLETLFTPGHSAGHCCFYLRQHGILYSGDHILSDISPNPILDKGKDGQRRRSMLEYLQSVEMVAALPVKLVYPGHGQPFTDLAAVLERFRDYHQQREQTVMAALDITPQTPYQIACQVYPDMKALDVFLGISKVWGHLDLLEQEGKVTVTAKDNVHYYNLR
ncbi:Glyoxylase, beta-lactamase superfamily II [Carboxydocella thermautotrophica]|nr:Glyoxylase, beta-lactamase superfamily II [Carboxydocella thermautotrophica]